MVYEKRIGKALVGGFALAIATAFTACDEPPPEKGALEKAGDAAGDALSSAGKSADEFLGKAGETVEDVMDKMGGALEPTGNEDEKVAQDIQEEKE